MSRISKALVQFMSKITAYSAASLIPASGVDPARWNKARCRLGS